jgi:hypothetical protein
MAEKDIQANDSKPPRRPDILRAKDIIPGSSGSAGKGDSVNNADIPRFDLAEDIMSEHRRMTSGRRKGPAGPAIPDSQLPSRPVAPPVPMPRPLSSRYGFSNGFNPASDPVIADIVARDIEGLCRGLWA